MSPDLMAYITICSLSSESIILVSNIYRVLPTNSS